MRRARHANHQQSSHRKSEPETSGSCRFGRDRRKNRFLLQVSQEFSVGVRVIFNGMWAEVASVGCQQIAFDDLRKSEAVHP